MKPICILLCFFILCKATDAQTVQYKCFVKLDCTDTVRPYKDYFLSKGNYAYYPNANFVCELPDTGTYFFSPTPEAKLNFSLSAIPIVIRSARPKSDTLKSRDLYKLLPIHSKAADAYRYEYWQFCGRPADGYVVDNTVDGRVEGLFKNGKAVQTVKYYNLQSQLVEVEHYDKKGKLKNAVRLVQ